MIGSTAVAPHPTTTGMHARLEAGRTFLAGEEGSGVSAMTRLVRAHPYERLSERAEADRLVGAGSGRPGEFGLVVLGATQYALSCSGGAALTRDARMIGSTGGTTY
jgi:hypothetical protein